MWRGLICGGRSVILGICFTPLSHLMHASDGAPPSLIPRGSIRLANSAEVRQFTFRCEHWTAGGVSR